MRIAQALLEDIIAHARGCYPEECCGLLIGRREPRFSVTRIHRAANLNRSRAHDRYEIDPREFHQVDKTTWGTEEEIIGFYHSHPGHPPFPSAFDRERAWSSYCYLIIGVNAEGESDSRAWVWRESPPRWEEEPLEVE